MKTYSFAIACRPVASGRDSHEIFDALYEAGCDDALVVERMGAFVLEFDREAVNFAKAVISALKNIVDAGLEPVRVAPDPLVNASEIAARAGVSRQAVSLYAKGDRQKGFPLPVARLDTAAPLWRWLDVARWFARFGIGDKSREAAIFAHLIERANRQVLPKLIQRTV